VVKHTLGRKAKGLHLT